MVVYVDGYGEMKTDKQINPPTDPRVTGDLRNSKMVGSNAAQSDRAMID